MTTKSLTDGTDSTPSAEMHLFDHLTELRRRLIYAALAIIGAALISFFWSTELFAALAQPLNKVFPPNSLIGTGPAEAFVLKLKVAFFSGVLLASPILFYQLWRFISPGLYSEERKLVIPFVAATTLLFLTGAGFCYAVVMPLALEFFEEQYQSIGVTPAIRISEHLSFMVKAIMGFGLVFEVPVLGYFLGRFGIIDDNFLIHWGRHAMVVIFILAAMLTPPDVLTQFLMAGPLIILYGITILIVRCTHKKKDSEPETPPEEDSIQEA